MATALQVLIVEDSPDSAQSLAMMLTLHGFQTQIALNGVQALRLAQVQSPEVVLLDLALPGMDGFEVARRLRTLPELGQLILIAVTGCTEPGLMERARREGFTRYFLKADPLKELIDFLQAYAAARSSKSR